MAKAGRIEIKVDTGSYPAWCCLYIDGEKVGQLNHREIGDLFYATRKAIQEARAALPDELKHEVLD